MDLAYNPNTVSTLTENFALTKEYFSDVDAFVCACGNFNRSSKLNEIREMLKDKISKTGILEFNAFLRSVGVEPIDNHIDWILEKGIPIKWDLITRSQAANDLIKHHIKHRGQLDWTVLSGNPAAIDMLLDNLDKVNLAVLSSNPAAVPFLRNNQHLIIWHRIAPLPEAIDIILENIDKIHLRYFMSNPLSVDYFKDYSYLIDWEVFSKNTNAVHLFHAKYDVLNWDYASANTGDKIELLARKHTQDINWSVASKNPALIKLLMDYPKKIDYNDFSLNTAAIEQLTEIANAATNTYKPLGDVRYDKYIGNKGTYIDQLFNELSVQESKKPDWSELSSNSNKSNPPFINWTNLSMNPAAIPLLAQYKNKINYDALMQNTYNYFTEKIRALKGAKLFPSSTFVIG